MVQLRVAVAAAAQDTAEGAVVTAAGGAADVLSEAAGMGRLHTGRWTAAAIGTIFSKFDLVLRVAMASPAQDIAEGAVVKAAGDTADIFSGVAGGAGATEFSVELQVDSSSDWN